MSRWLSAALVLFVAVAAGLAVLSGGSGADPRTPAALAGLPAPFLGMAVVGSGGLAAAVDAYGDVVDMRAPGPAGAALIDNPADRQAAGSVPVGTGIVPRVRIGGRPAMALWHAGSVAQRYLPGTNVIETVASFALPGGRRGEARVEITDVARGTEFARLVRIVAPRGVEVAPALSIHLAAGVGAHCTEERRRRALALICAPTSTPAPAAPRFGPTTGDRARPVFATVRRMVALAARQDRRWLARARPLGPAAPPWGWRMYRRSLLVLRALTDRRTGAVAAGLRDGWAYVWPRDAATAALALAASGYRSEARRVARFLGRLDLGAAARFGGNGVPVPGRAAQGDAAGWVAVAERAVAAPSPSRSVPATVHPAPWRNRADYQEGAPGDYLANAIAARDARLLRTFASPRGLAHRADDPASGLDSAAAWAVRPFPQPALFPLVRRTLLRLARHQSRFGITPGEDWPDADPWTAPTAWTALSLAALGERRQALRLLADLRRASTPAGDLPERVALRTGVPRSTTPLAWSHAFAILALRQLWPESEHP